MGTVWWLCKSVNALISGEKESKPVSGRVKEIAEFMLSCVMEKIVRTYVLLWTFLNYVNDHYHRLPKVHFGYKLFNSPSVLAGHSGAWL